MRKRFFESRKGVSVMVSYILLVVFLIIISGIVYQWLKTYVPRQALECPDGTSLFIKEAAFDPVNSQLAITLRNNGRFDLAGYFVYATNSSDQELPTIDLSGYLNESEGSGIILGNSVLFFEGGSNLFSPDSEDTYLFDIPVSVGEPSSIRIIPTRFQEVEGKSRFVSCGDARVEILVSIMTVLIVFAGSAENNGNLGGLEGADIKCNEWASSANLEGSFRAWLSTDSINAKDRINDEIYALVNGKFVAKNKLQLISGNLLHPINLTHTGEGITGMGSEGRAWTGTDESGISTGQNCNNWLSSSGVSGTRGHVNAINAEWTNFNIETCNDDTRIYCFQIE